MDEAAITRYITDTFPGVHVLVLSDDSYFFADPDQKMPFATLVTGDRHDRASDLDRPGVFRLNVGVSRDTYQALFGPLPARPGATGIVETGHDFTALDRLLPHPVYAYLSWVCVLNPGEATFGAVRPLLAEAHDRAVRRRPRAGGDAGGADE